MPNGGEHHERLGVCPLCGSPRIRIRQQRHQNLLWRCSGCNGVFRTPKVAEYIIPPGNDGSGYVFAESIPQMERRGRLRGRPSRRRHGTGWGCAIIIAVAVIAVIAAYSALERNAEFPGADIIRTFVEGTPEAYQEAQSSDIDSTDSGSHDTQDERQQYPDPAQRHHELKELMVQLTNEHRATAGVPSVRLGFNTAAQLHAEAALQGCYSSHWDQWGLKPNHRYTLTGGTGADAENGSGLDYCIKPSQNYTPIEGMEREVIEAVQGWMASPGHRRNLLDPAHTILNVGIAHDQFNVILVQHFSSDYVNYTTKPGIDPGGVLLLEGEVSGATLSIGDSVNAVITYDPPPKPLTRGQLAYTYSLCNSTTVAYVVEPLLPGWSYSTPAVRTDVQTVRCVDPYQTPVDRPAPDSPGEAHDAWASAKSASEAAQPVTTQERRIIADRMDITSAAFTIRADLSTVLREHGPGIYTILLWGRPDHMRESTPLSEQAFFWLTEPPKEAPYLNVRSTDIVDR